MQFFTSLLTHLSQTGFSIGIAVMAVSIRMPFDAPWTLGGDLSRLQRWLAICLTITLLTGRGFKLSQGPLLWRLSYAVSNVLITWICLTTAYVLRCFMMHRINIGNPGRPIQSWLIVLSTMVATGIIFALFTDNVRFLSLVRLANALSTIPVLQALKQYNILTTPTGPNRGRGAALSQAMVLFERYFCLIMVAAAIGDIGQQFPLPKEEDLSQFQVFLRLLRSNDLILHSQIRIIFHIIFVNVLDEMNQMHPASSSNASNDGPSSGSSGFYDSDISEPEDVTHMTTELVPLKC
mmetsp:Transcript_11400/g.18902  ORF Transcript_11400/g.18902 Transcript_11400/m.18902 type:complete len:293 (+) Transcript_11400:107-985(+)